MEKENMVVPAALQRLPKLFWKIVNIWTRTQTELGWPQRDPERARVLWWCRSGWGQTDLHGWTTGSEQCQARSWSIWIGNSNKNATEIGLKTCMFADDKIILQTIRVQKGRDRRTEEEDAKDVDQPGSEQFRLHHIDCFQAAKRSTLFCTSKIRNLSTIQPFRYILMLWICWDTSAVTSFLSIVWRDRYLTWLQRLMNRSCWGSQTLWMIGGVQEKPWPRSRRSSIQRGLYFASSYFFVERKFSSVRQSVRGQDRSDSDKVFQ